MPPPRTTCATSPEHPHHRVGTPGAPRRTRFAAAMRGEQQRPAGDGQVGVGGQQRQHRLGHEHGDDARRRSDGWPGGDAPTSPAVDRTDDGHIGQCRHRLGPEQVHVPGGVAVEDHEQQPQHRERLAVARSPRRRASSGTARATRVTLARITARPPLPKVAQATAVKTMAAVASSRPPSANRMFCAVRVEVSGRRRGGRRRRRSGRRGGPAAALRRARRAGLAADQREAAALRRAPP